jgi:hypothetical protein
LGTVHLDYILPKRFELEYIGKDNAPHRPVKQVINNLRWLGWQGDAIRNGRGTCVPPAAESVPAGGKTDAGGTPASFKAGVAPRNGGFPG